MNLEIIVAMDEGRVIGRDNDLPWRLPADLRHFKKTTMGHPVLMGRRTWESVGKPLPGRTTIVVTSRPDLHVPDGVLVASSLGQAIDLAAGTGAGTAFVVGGAGLYREALPLAHRLHLTRVHAHVDGDVRFPRFDEQEWELAAERRFAADERNQYDLTFQTYVRRQSDPPPRATQY
ncbi:MAG: dihydrofolate reductase [Gemmatimonadota bacterium]|nr:MAG: dihydrofolate reductase [Gemmatimonadota bacterium]